MTEYSNPHWLGEINDSTVVEGDIETVLLPSCPLYLDGLVLADDDNGSHQYKVPEPTLEIQSIMSRSDFQQVGKTVLMQINAAEDVKDSFEVVNVEEPLLSMVVNI